MINARKILLKKGGDKAVQLRVVTTATWQKICSDLSQTSQKWAEAQNFTGAAGDCLQVPDREGGVAEVIAPH